MLKVLLSSLFCFLLIMPFSAQAMGTKPEPFQGDEAALLGLYASSGITQSIILVSKETMLNLLFKSWK